MTEQAELLALRAERDALVATCVRLARDNDLLKRAVDLATETVDILQTQRDDLRAEVDRLRAQIGAPAWDYKAPSG